MITIQQRLRDEQFWKYASDISESETTNHDTSRENFETQHLFFFTDLLKCEVLNQYRMVSMEEVVSQKNNLQEERTSS